MTPKEKLIAAGALFATWGGLVVFGLVPAADFTTAIRDALIGLGVFQAALTNPGNAPKE